MVKENKNNSVHIILIILLSFIFFALMLSTSFFSNTSITYNMFEEINLSENSGEIRVGEIFIKNNGILPARTQLDNYVLCYQNNEDIRNFNLNYKGDFSRNYNDVFGSNSFEYVDVSRNDEIKLSLTTYLSIWDFQSDIVEKNQTSALLYLVKIPKEIDYSFDYCSRIDLGEEKVIKINFNLNDYIINELKDNTNSYKYRY